MKYVVTAMVLVLVVAIIARAWILVNLNDFGDPMLNAARDADVPGLRELLANGANANRSDAYGNTPLSIAAHFGQTEAAELLITCGAAIEGSGNGEMTPLQCAVYSRHPKTAACLLSHNADPNRADKYGTTALMLSCCQWRRGLGHRSLEFGCRRGTGRRSRLAGTAYRVTVKSPSGIG